MHDMELGRTMHAAACPRPRCEPMSYRGGQRYSMQCIPCAAEPSSYAYGKYGQGLPGQRGPCGGPRSLSRPSRKLSLRRLGFSQRAILDPGNQY